MGMVWPMVGCLNNLEFTVLLQHAEFPQWYIPVKEGHVDLSGALCVCTMVSPMVEALRNEKRGGVMETSCKVGSACRMFLYDFFDVVSAMVEFGNETDSCLLLFIFGLVTKEF